MFAQCNANGNVSVSIPSPIDFDKQIRPSKNDPNDNWLEKRVLNRNKLLDRADIGKKDFI